MVHGARNIRQESKTLDTNPTQSFSHNTSTEQPSNDNSSFLPFLNFTNCGCSNRLCGTESDLRTAWCITDTSVLSKHTLEPTELKPGYTRLSPVVIGLCGSDDRYVHQNPDTAPANRKRPPNYVVGHEVIARVKESSGDTNGIEKDALVAVNPHTKPLLPGKIGQRDNLIPGRNNYLATPMDAGAFDTNFQHPTSRLIPLPKDVNLNAMALAEPMACAMNAVMKLLKVMDPKCHPKNGANPLSNSTIVVQGAGSIGQCASILLANINEVMDFYKEMPRTEGGKGTREIFSRPVENLRILVTCVNESQVNNLHELFNQKSNDMLQRNIEILPVMSQKALGDLSEVDGRYNCETYQAIADSPYFDPQRPGASAVIECSGGGTALEQAAQRVRPGGQIIHVARNQFDPAIAQRGEKSLHPTYRFKNKHFEQTIGMLSGEKLPQVKDMPLEHFNWDETPDAFDRSRRTANKRVVHCEPITDTQLKEMYDALDDKAALQRTQYANLVNAEGSELPDIAKELSTQTGIEADLETGQLRYGENFEPLSLSDEAGNPVSVIFVRHGQVPDNVEPRTFNGNVDRPSTQLSPKGEAQARDAGNVTALIGRPVPSNAMLEGETIGASNTIAWLENQGWDNQDVTHVQTEGFPITQVYSSPLGRAHDTATAGISAMEKSGQAPRSFSAIEGLREMSFGSADGRKLISVNGANPYHLLRSDQNGLAKDTFERYNSKNKSENFAEVLLRVNTTLRNLKIPAGSQSIALYSHSLTGAAARALFGRAPLVDGIIQFDGGKGMMKNATPYVLSLGKP